MRKISIVILILILIPFLSFAEGITISNNAIKNYGIETTITDKKEVVLPRSALVVSRDNYFIYLKNGDSFEEQQIYPVKVTKDSVTFKYDTVKEREFVIQGAPYLRIIFLNNNDSGAE